MINDKKRREVANELRKLTAPGCIRYAEEFYEELREIVACDLDGSFEGVANSLAELINPTCKRVLMDGAGCPPFYTGRLALNNVVGGCSECGYPFGNSNARIGNPFNAPNYCPNCGAEVLDR